MPEVQQLTPLARVKALNAQLQVWRHAYYVKSDPVVTDEVYDNAEKELRRLVAESPQFEPLATVLKAVGSDLAAATLEAGVKHKHPMLSLTNAYTWEDVERWLITVPESATFVLEPKVDGLSLSVRYANWTIWLALTRGDGEVGEDVTQAAMAILDVPHEIDKVMLPPDLEVRGEVFFTRQQFARLNAEVAAAGKDAYKNSRNLASGTLKLKDPREVAKRRLSFQPWQVLGLEPASWVPDTAEGMARLGYRIPDGFEHTQALEWWSQHSHRRQHQSLRVYDRAHLRDAIEKARVLRDTLWADIIGDTDGIVIKVEEHHIRKELGVSTGVPNWAIAFKFPAERATTVLNGVTWQVGRTGKLTPVAELNPVLVSGSTVARASLSNVTYMTNLGIQIGDTVSIYKGGEVIPQVEGVHTPGESREPVQVPDVCPECGEALLSETTEESGITQLYCENPFCPGRLISHLTYVGARACLDIEGLGDVLSEQFVRQGIVCNLGSLWEWANDTQTFLDAYGEAALRSACEDAGFGMAQTLDLLRGCTKARTAGWDSWLMALGIPGVAKELSKALAAYLILQPEDLPNLTTRLLELAPKQVEGLGIEKLKGIAAWAQDPRAVQCLQQLHDAGVRPRCTVEVREGDQPLKGYTICITGEFGPERTRLQKQLEGLGAQCKSGVSKKVNLLLVGEGAGRNKTAKAAELGIQQEGREWLVRIFQAAGMELESRGTEDIPDVDDFSTL